MGKIGKSIVKKQKANRESSGFVTPEKVFDIKKYDGEWTNFAKDSVHKINIIPWKIKSKDDLVVKMKGDFHKEVGEYVYSLNYWVHPRIHGEKDVLCLKKCFGKSCPICDEAQKKWDVYNADKTDENKKAANALSPKLRSMYNIEILADKLRGKNSFFEASDYIFEDELLDKATECEDGEDAVAFYEIDEEEGKIVKFKRPKDTKKPFKSFEFLDRKKAISKDLLNGVIRFGEVIPIPTLEEVSDFYYGGSYIPDEEDSDDDDDDDDDEEETIEEEYQKDSDDIDNDDDDDDDDDDDEPPKKEKKKSKKEKGKKKKGGDKEACPHGHVYGKEFGDHDECDECDVAMACFKKSKE